MSDDIMKNIKNAAQGNPYSGLGISLNSVQPSSMNDISTMSSNAMKLGNPMRLTHSMNNLQTLGLHESCEEN